MRYHFIPGLYSTKDEVPCYPEFDGSKICYAENKDNWYRYYAPKTDYSYSTGLRDTNVSEYSVPGCEPVMLYLFSRHSARFPDLGDLLKMSQMLHKVREWILEAAEQGKTKLCDKDIEELRNWKQGYSFSDAALSMDQGNIDTHMIAERFKKMFPTLLPPVYSSKTYKFGYSNRDRTNQSLQSFAEILFNETEYAKIEYPKADVKVVSFHKYCERRLWPHNTKIKREWFEEPEAFRVGPVAQRLVRNLKARLGIQDKPIGYKKPDESHYKAVLYFVHSRDYKKLLGSFDLFSGDDPFTADAYCSEKTKNRMWRDATFSPYSAQLGFVLFKCQGTYKVLTLVNEKPVELPRCSYLNGDFLCDLREFVSRYHVKNCNLDKICVPSALNEKWPDSHWEDV
ncbi:multiple inositol polyphosphate phosphatase 1-like [Tropilaelaps mercedesae]|uniref:Multiple inositol polyphosphate phosphatase 1-like n=1 Tax=Tropilaelaps mercedesae TaxID=418985 RepID=A0A1V9X1X4_9ACAR|nr:multiple inositol polyphosphate phosphatase 1-like [Tropilaelaps mercedesae]